MNKVNWIDGRYTTPNDFNAMQSNPENHLRSQAKALLSGYSDIGVTGSPAGLALSPGVAWDSRGRRIFVPASADIDISSVDRPASGRYRWLRVSVSYRQVERDTMRDKGGVDRPAYYDDGYAVALATGPEFTARNLDSARRTADGRPAVPGGAVNVALFLIDHDSTWATMVENRAEGSIPFHGVLPQARFIPGSIAFATGSTEDEIYSAINGIVPADGSQLFGWGALWASDTAPGVGSKERWYPVLYAYRDRPTRIAIVGARTELVPSVGRVFTWLVHARQGNAGIAGLSAAFFVPMHR